MTWTDVQGDFQRTQSAAVAAGMTATAAAAAQGAADAAALSGGGGIDSRLINLAPNTALDLGPLTLTPPAGETITSAQQIVANSGCAYDPVRQRLVFFGGGHRATNYDGVLCFNLGDLTWSEEYTPTPIAATTWTNFNGDSGQWLDGQRPLARHTGDQIEIVNDELVLLCAVEGNGIAPLVQAWVDGQRTDWFGNAATAEYLLRCHGQVAHYSFANKAWAFESAALTNTDGDGAFPIHQGACRFDPVSGLILWVTQYCFYTYDPVARIKTKYVPAGDANRALHKQGWPLGTLKDESGANVANTLSYTGNLQYCAANDTFYFFDLGNHVWRPNLDRSNFGATTLTRLTTTGSPPVVAVGSATYPNGERAVRYDSHNNVFGCGPYNNIFYTFDPNTKAWSTTTVQGNVLPGSSFFNGKPALYIADANVRLFVTDTNNPAPAPKLHLFAYRWQ